MSDNPNLVRAVNPNGTERDVPAHWVDPERSPFPGRWKPVKEEKTKAAPSKNVSSVAGDGTEDPATPTTKTGA